MFLADSNHLCAGSGHANFTFPLTEIARFSLQAFKLSMQDFIERYKDQKVDVIAGNASSLAFAYDLMACLCCSSCLTLAC